MMNEEFEQLEPAQEDASAGPQMPPLSPAPDPAPKKKAGASLVAAALCFSLLGSALGAGGVLLAQKLSACDRPTNAQNTILVEGLRQQSTIDTVTVDTGTELTPAQVYAANVNSTVGITTSVTTNFWGFQTTSAASGSGFIISPDGYILTNFHVIEDSSSISVALYDGTTYDAALIGYDASNDIAVLKVEAENLTPVVLGDSDSLNVGDSVMAIGNPLGELTFSLTSGLVSAMDREVTFSGNITMNLIQTDCAINSGNSGGALFNRYGEVVGVTNAKYSSSSSGASIDNIGFAIPINTIRPIVESIIEKGYISKPYIGVTVMDVTQEAQLYGIPAGVAVQSVSDDSPAQEAGLQAGDVITAAQGTAMDRESLVKLVGSMEVGQELLLDIYRQGQTLEVTVIIGEQIRSALPQEEAPAPQNQSAVIPFGGFGSKY